MDDPHVLITHYVGPDRAEELAAELRPVVDGDIRVAYTEAETMEYVTDAAVAITTRFPPDLLAAADDLAWVHVLSAGVDHLDLDAFADRGVAVTNSSGVHAQPIAEQTMGYAITFERNLHAARRNQERGVWERVEGGELRDKTLGIIGVGSIGSRVAELASAFGMDVLGTKRDPETMPDAVDEGFGADAYPEVCRRSDYLVLACPLTEETEGLIGREELRLLGSDGVLINVARGEVVDQDALVGALQNGRIRGAGLDTFETEPLPTDSVLWDLSTVVITPHMAGSNPNTLRRWRRLVETNYERLVAGDEELENRVV